MQLLIKRLSFFAILIFLFSCKKENDLLVTSGKSLISKRAHSARFSSDLQLVTNINVLTSQIYQLSNLSVDSTYYTDRNYQITSFPAALNGALIIKTAEADKTDTASVVVSFQLTQSATVYVGYDSRATNIPAWLQGWQKLTDTMAVNDPKLAFLNLYSKSFNAGNVSIGGNMAMPAAGVYTNYILFAKAINPLSVSGSLVLGINGHSLGTPSYQSIPVAQQIAMLKKMGMSIYRQDISFNNDGTISNLSLFTQLYAVSNASGITILPMIYPQTLDYSQSESKSYTLGSILGKNVASKNSQYFQYYELGNELDNRVITSGNGDDSTEYDLNKFKIAAAYLKGMNDGIKSVQPDAQTMVDASWLHYAFLQMLISYGVNFDIIAYHWYSEMENITNSGSIGVTDITAKLSSLFNKPIWFTEVGNRYKPLSDIDQLQSDFVTSFEAKCKKNPQVKALIFYELLNEPEKNSLLESNYGLVNWMTIYTQWQYKLAAQSLFVN